MRSTKVLSFLAASIAMLSRKDTTIFHKMTRVEHLHADSPVAYASLIPTVIETPMGKRCIPPGSCRIKELVSIFLSSVSEVSSFCDSHRPVTPIQTK